MTKNNYRSKKNARRIRYAKSGITGAQGIQGAESSKGVESGIKGSKAGEWHNGYWYQYDEETGRKVHWVPKGGGKAVPCYLDEVLKKEREAKEQGIAAEYGVDQEKWNKANEAIKRLEQNGVDITKITENPATHTYSIQWRDGKSFVGNDGLSIDGVLQCIHDLDKKFSTSETDAAEKSEKPETQTRPRVDASQENDKSESNQDEKEPEPIKLTSRGDWTPQKDTPSADDVALCRRVANNLNHGWADAFRKIADVMKSGDVERARQMFTHAANNALDIYRRAFVCHGDGGALGEMIGRDAESGEDGAKKALEAHKTIFAIGVRELLKHADSMEFLYNAKKDSDFSEGLENYNEPGDGKDEEETKGVDAGDEETRESEPKNETPEDAARSFIQDESNAPDETQAEPQSADDRQITIDGITDSIKAFKKKEASLRGRADDLNRLVEVKKDYKEDASLQKQFAEKLIKQADDLEKKIDDAVAQLSTEETEREEADSQGINESAEGETSPGEDAARAISRSVAQNDEGDDLQDELDGAREDVEPDLSERSNETNETLNEEIENESSETTEPQAGTEELEEESTSGEEPRAELESGADNEEIADETANGDGRSEADLEGEQEAEDVADDGVTPEDAAREISAMADENQEDEDNSPEIDYDNIDRCVYRTRILSGRYTSGPNENKYEHTQDLLKRLEKARDTIKENQYEPGGYAYALEMSRVLYGFTPSKGLARNTEYRSVLNAIRDEVKLSPDKINEAWEHFVERGINTAWFVRQVATAAFGDKFARCDHQIAFGKHKDEFVPEYYEAVGLISTLIEKSDKFRSAFTDYINALNRPSFSYEKDSQSAKENATYAMAENLGRIAAKFINGDISKLTDNEWQKKADALEKSWGKEYKESKEEDDEDEEELDDTESQIEETQNVDEDDQEAIDVKPDASTPEEAAMSVGQEADALPEETSQGADTADIERQIKQAEANAQQCEDLAEFNREQGFPTDYVEKKAKDWRQKAEELRSQLNGGENAEDVATEEAQDSTATNDLTQEKLDAADQNEGKPTVLDQASKPDALTLQKLTKEYDELKQEKKKLEAEKKRKRNPKVIKQWEDKIKEVAERMGSLKDEIDGVTNPEERDLLKKQRRVDILKEKLRKERQPRTRFDLQDELKKAEKERNDAYEKLYGENYEEKQLAEREAREKASKEANARIEAEDERKKNAPIAEKPRYYGLEDEPPTTISDTSRPTGYPRAAEYSGLDGDLRNMHDVLIGEEKLSPDGAQLYVDLGFIDQNGNFTALAQKMLDAERNRRYDNDALEEIGRNAFNNIPILKWMKDNGVSGKVYLNSLKSKFVRSGVLTEKEGDAMIETVMTLGTHEPLKNYIGDGKGRYAVLIQLPQDDQDNSSRTEQDAKEGDQEAIDVEPTSESPEDAAREIAAIAGEKPQSVEESKENPQELNDIERKIEETRNINSSSIPKDADAQQAGDYIERVFQRTQGGYSLQSGGDSYLAQAALRDIKPYLDSAREKERGSTSYKALLKNALSRISAVKPVWTGRDKNNVDQYANVDQLREILQAESAFTDDEAIETINKTKDSFFPNNSKEAAIELAKISPEFRKLYLDFVNGYFGYQSEKIDPILWQNAEVPDNLSAEDKRLIALKQQMDAKIIDYLGTDEGAQEAIDVEPSIETPEEAAQAVGSITDETSKPEIEESTPETTQETDSTADKQDSRDEYSQVINELRTLSRNINRYRNPQRKAEAQRRLQELKDRKEQLEAEREETNANVQDSSEVVNDEPEPEWKSKVAELEKKKQELDNEIDKRERKYRRDNAGYSELGYKTNPRYEQGLKDATRELHKQINSLNDQIIDLTPEEYLSESQKERLDERRKNKEERERARQETLDENGEQWTEDNKNNRRRLINEAEDAIKALGFFVAHEDARRRAEGDAYEYDYSGGREEFLKKVEDNIKELREFQEELKNGGEGDAMEVAKWLDWQEEELYNVKNEFDLSKLLPTSVSLNAKQTEKLQKRIARYKEGDPLDGVNKRRGDEPVDDYLHTLQTANPGSFEQRRAYNMLISALGATPESWTASKRDQYQKLDVNNLNKQLQKYVASDVPAALEARPPFNCDISKYKTIKDVVRAEADKLGYGQYFRDEFVATNPALCVAVARLLNAAQLQSAVKAYGLKDTSDEMEAASRIVKRSLDNLTRALQDSFVEDDWAGKIENQNAQSRHDRHFARAARATTIKNRELDNRFDKWLRDNYDDISYSDNIPEDHPDRDAIEHIRNIVEKQKKENNDNLERLRKGFSGHASALEKTFGQAPSDEGGIDPSGRYLLGSDQLARIKNGEYGDEDWWKDEQADFNARNDYYNSIDYDEELPAIEVEEDNLTPEQAAQAVGEIADETPDERQWSPEKGTDDEQITINGKTMSRRYFRSQVDRLKKLAKQYDQEDDAHIEFANATTNKKEKARRYREAEECREKAFNARHEAEEILRQLGEWTQKENDSIYEIDTRALEEFDPKEENKTPEQAAQAVGEIADETPGDEETAAQAVDNSAGAEENAPTTRVDVRTATSALNAITYELNEKYNKARSQSAKSKLRAALAEVSAWTNRLNDPNRSGEYADILDAAKYSFSPSGDKNKVFQKLNSVRQFLDGYDSLFQSGEDADADENVEATTTPDTENVPETPEETAQTVGEIAESAPTPATPEESAQEVGQAAESAEIPGDVAAQETAKIADEEPINETEDAEENQDVSKDNTTDLRDPRVPQFPKSTKGMTEEEKARVKEEKQAYASWNKKKKPTHEVVSKLVNKYINTQSGLADLLNTYGSDKVRYTTEAIKELEGASEEDFDKVWDDFEDRLLDYGDNELDLGSRLVCKLALPLVFAGASGETVKNELMSEIDKALSQSTTKARTKILEFIKGQLEKEYAPDEDDEDDTEGWAMDSRGFVPGLNLSDVDNDAQTDALASIASSVNGYQREALIRAISNPELNKIDRDYLLYVIRTQSKNKAFIGQAERAAERANRGDVPERSEFQLLKEISNLKYKRQRALEEFKKVRDRIAQERDKGLDWYTPGGFERDFEQLNRNSQDLKGSIRQMEGVKNRVKHLDEKLQTLTTELNELSSNAYNNLTEPLEDLETGNDIQARSEEENWRLTVDNHRKLIDDLRKELKETESLSDSTRDAIRKQRERRLQTALEGFDRFSSESYPKERALKRQIDEKKEELERWKRNRREIESYKIDKYYTQKNKDDDIADRDREIERAESELNNLTTQLEELQSAPNQSEPPTPETSEPAEETDALTFNEGPENESLDDAEKAALKGARQFSSGVYNLGLEESNSRWERAIRPVTKKQKELENEPDIKKRIAGLQELSDELIQRSKTDSPFRQDYANHANFVINREIAELKRSLENNGNTPSESEPPAQASGPDEADQEAIDVEPTSETPEEAAMSVGNSVDAAQGEETPSDVNMKDFMSSFKWPAGITADSLVRVEGRTWRLGEIITAIRSHLRRYQAHTSRADEAVKANAKSSFYESPQRNLADKSLNRARELRDGLIKAINEGDVVFRNYSEHELTLDEALDKTKGVLSDDVRETIARLVAEDEHFHSGITSRSVSESLEKIANAKDDVERKSELRSLANDLIVSLYQGHFHSKDKQIIKEISKLAHYTADDVSKMDLHDNAYIERLANDLDVDRSLLRDVIPGNPEICELVADYLNLENERLLDHIEYGYEYGRDAVKSKISTNKANRTRAINKAIAQIKQILNGEDASEFNWNIDPEPAPMTPEESAARAVSASVDEPEVDEETEENEATQEREPGAALRGLSKAWREKQETTNEAEQTETPSLTESLESEPESETLPDVNVPETVDEDETEENERYSNRGEDGYYSIDEDAAKRAQEANSFREYKPNTITNDYRALVDDARKVAEEQKKKVDPMYHERIDSILNRYERELANWYNKWSRNQASYPSWMITGRSNYNWAKNKRKSERTIALSGELEKIQDLLSDVKSVGTGGISSDDSNAVLKIENKIARLKDLQEKMKEANKYWRKNQTWEGYDGPLQISDYDRRRNMPFTFELSNNNAEIRRNEKRLQQLKATQGANFGDDVPFDGGVVHFNKEANRIQLKFDDKPDAETISKLKSNGFKWSPREKAWQRMLNGNGIYAAKSLGYLPEDYKAKKGEEPAPTAPEPTESEPDDQTPEDAARAVSAMADETTSPEVETPTPAPEPETASTAPEPVAEETTTAPAPIEKETASPEIDEKPNVTYEEVKDLFTGENGVDSALSFRGTEYKSHVFSPLFHTGILDKQGLGMAGAFIDDLAPKVRLDGKYKGGAKINADNLRERVIKPFARLLGIEPREGELGPSLLARMKENLESRKSRLLSGNENFNAFMNAKKERESLVAEELKKTIKEIPGADTLGEDKINEIVRDHVNSGFTEIDRGYVEDAIKEKKRISGLYEDWQKEMDAENFPSFNDIEREDSYFFHDCNHDTACFIGSAYDQYGGRNRRDNLYAANMSRNSELLSNSASAKKAYALAHAHGQSSLNPGFYSHRALDELVRANQRRLNFKEDAPGKWTFKGGSLSYVFDPETSTTHFELQLSQAPCQASLNKLKEGYDKRFRYKDGVWRSPDIQPADKETDERYYAERFQKLGLLPIDFDFTDHCQNGELAQSKPKEENAEFETDDDSNSGIASSFISKDEKTGNGLDKYDGAYVIAGGKDIDNYNAVWRDFETPADGEEFRENNSIDSENLLGFIGMPFFRRESLEGSIERDIAVHEAKERLESFYQGARGARARKALAISYSDAANNCRGVAHMRVADELVAINQKLINFRETKPGVWKFGNMGQLEFRYFPYTGERQMALSFGGKIRMGNSEGSFNTITTDNLRSMGWKYDKYDKTWTSPYIKNGLDLDRCIRMPLQSIGLLPYYFDYNGHCVNEPKATQDDRPTQYARMTSEDIARMISRAVDRYYAKSV